MSKEQTPIERLREEIERSEILSDNTKRILSLIDWNRKIQEEEEFTKAKVLEALEREFSQVAIFDKNGKSKTGIDYFKTEVKPKYTINE